MKYRPLKGKEICKALQRRLGYRVRATQGSHVQLVDEDNHQVTVPVHGEVSPRTLLSISFQAGMTKDDFLRLFE
ncbi:MAG: type II toxin-antitoxin system HicA family toxin [Thaumarchaeota archaeon]|nr:type II toxin-antitoxin system HicA family toxin [Nitrososphaerota archaeon]